MVSLRDWPVGGRRPREHLCRGCGHRGTRRSCQAVELVTVGVQPTCKCAGRALGFKPATSGLPGACPVVLQGRGQLPQGVDALPSPPVGVALAGSPRRPPISRVTRSR